MRYKEEKTDTRLDKWELTKEPIHAQVNLMQTSPYRYAADLIRGIEQPVTYYLRSFSQDTNGN